MCDYLTACGQWDDSKEQALKDRVHQQVDDAVAGYEKLTEPAPTAMFDHLYETVPTPLLDQYQALKEHHDE